MHLRLRLSGIYQPLELSRPEKLLVVMFKCAIITVGAENRASR